MGKGGDFEREVSKMFTKWLTGTVKPYKYWRMPGSGGLATIHEENVNLGGDIRSLAVDAEFLTDCFSIECKTGYPTTSFWQHFKKIKTFHIKAFWEQCIHDAVKAQKRPMLIYRKKGNQIIVAIARADQDCLETLSDDLAVMPCLSMRYETKELPEMVFYDFKDFFNAVTPDNIKDYLKVVSRSRNYQESKGCLKEYYKGKD